MFREVCYLQNVRASVSSNNIKDKIIEEAYWIEKGALGEYEKIALQNRFMENGALDKKNTTIS